MKSHFVSFLIMLIVLSCANTNSQDSGRTVQGIYVMRSKSDFSIADDTIAITPIVGQQTMYFIKRSVGYQRVTKNGVLPKETKQEITTAIWEPSSRQLKEQKRGRVYSLSMDDNQLMIGATVYAKMAGR